MSGQLDWKKLFASKNFQAQKTTINIQSSALLEEIFEYIIQTFEVWSFLCINYDLIAVAINMLNNYYKYSKFYYHSCFTESMHFFLFRVKKVA